MSAGMGDAMDQLARSYLLSCRLRGLATATVVTRAIHLRQFAAFVADRGVAGPRDVDPPLLEAYRLVLFEHRQRNGTPLAWSTQAHKLAAVRQLFAWARRAGAVERDPAIDLELPRVPRHLPRAVLSVPEVELVLAQPALRTVLGLRDRAIMELMYSSGVRRAEVVTIGCGDVDFSRGALLVREGKGARDRWVPVGRRALRWIAEYRDRGRPRHVVRRDPGTMFVSSRGTRVRPSRLTERLHAYIQRAGVHKPGSCHIFRHTMATLMHDGGADVRDLQAMLGHADLSTTQVYTHVSVERLRQVHARTHPAERGEDGEAARGTW